MRDKGVRDSGAASPGSRVSDLPSVLTCTTLKTLLPTCCCLRSPAQASCQYASNAGCVIRRLAWPRQGKATIESLPADHQRGPISRPCSTAASGAQQQLCSCSSRVCCKTQNQFVEMLTSSGLRGCSSAPGERAACRTRRLESTAMRPFAVFAKSREVVNSVGPTPAMKGDPLKPAEVRLQVQPYSKCRPLGKHSCYTAADATLAPSLLAQMKLLRAGNLGTGRRCWHAYQPQKLQAHIQKSQLTCAPDSQAKIHLLPIGQFAVLRVNLFHHALQHTQKPVLHSSALCNTLN